MNVILLHGLWMNRWVMRVLGHRLEQNGFRPIYFTYATTRATPREHAHSLAAHIRQHHLTPCHFVAHSLGGLVLRHLFDIAPDVIHPQSRAVTLGTPHQGSAVARFLHQNYPALLGKSWDLGLNGTMPTWHNPLPLGNIVGTSGTGGGRWLCSLAQPNDGTVAVCETELPQSYPLHLACGHTALLFDREAAEQTAYFLQHGQWNLNKYQYVE